MPEGVTTRCMLGLVPSRFRQSGISFQSAEIDISKSGSKSVVYEFRTKSAQSGALETNGRRDGILGLSRHAVVRRFACKARGYWASMHAGKPAENVGRGRTGGEGGIRTPDTVARMPHFECGAIDHSATSPWPHRAQTAPSVGRYLSKAARRDKGAAASSSVRLIRFRRSSDLGPSCSHAPGPSPI